MVALCLVLAVTGAVIVLWPEAETGLTEQAGLRWGHLAGLFSSLFAAVGFVCIRRFSARHPLAHFFHFSVVAFVLTVLVQLLHDGPAIPPAAALTGIAIGGMLGGLGQMMIYAAVAYIPPGSVTVISMGEILVAAVGAYFLFNESISPGVFCGGAMILAAAFGINYDSARTANRAPRP